MLLLLFTPTNGTPVDPVTTNYVYRTLRIAKSVRGNRIARGR